MVFRLLSDSMQYLASPVPYHLRAMGYLVELKELGARRNRCQSAWRPHLETTRALILEAAQCCAEKGKALIIGSGLLFDIPLVELSQRYGGKSMIACFIRCLD